MARFSFIRRSGVTAWAHWRYWLCAIHWSKSRATFVHARIKTLGDSNVVIVIQGWVDQTRSSFVKVKSEAIRLVKEAFDHADYEMPEPIYRLRVENSPGGDSMAPASSSAPGAGRSPSGPAVAPSPRLREGDTTVEDDIHRQGVCE